ncbi:NAD-dependent DNA ligase LigA [Spirochaeta thermophila]|uniref:DNA ligase n=1 Tax=Winmispira thermophila (strain ATCC 49972 / DSM 6192 / RI 19.B1) TaxID=665571 RepID=E0RRX9_WINT6|nr:NAD-dependent DNA ligase LigA [Spirochaeta thermophila]ADN01766.1 DNA ligase [Spirochaeta thermophila DSM 6192]
MTEQEAKKEIDRLVELLQRADYEYYVLGRPHLTDQEYDSLFDRLKTLEAQFPHLKRADSPTQRVGSDLTVDFPEVAHTIPVLSLDKAYTETEVLSWIEKTERAAGRPLGCVIEEKIDGVSLVLYYRGGILDRAVTRGNGRVGNDITPNARTIRQIPLRIPETGEVVVRGEVYLPLQYFDEINARMEVPYANPRNLAGGVLRRKNSAEVARVPLHFLAYDGYLPFPVATYTESLDLLIEWGFPVNPRHERIPAGTPDRAERIRAFIEKERTERATLDYQIDGLVFKVNELDVRDRLGYTGHHPRWAIAYKFEAPQAVTELVRIDVQVGRTGRVTPVARLKPVELSGSTISNVTLHNEDYVQALELAPGDLVAISKRGDVIPAIEKVVEKNEEGVPVWRMPEHCPECSSRLERRGAHHFCPNRSCPAVITGRLKFFVSPKQMDIRVLGNETIDFLVEKGYIRRIPDLYTFDYRRLLDEPGFGEKKINLIVQGIEESKRRPFSTVLVALGIPDVGPSVVETLIRGGITGIDRLLEIADRGDVDALTRLEGIGEKTARQLIETLRDPEWRKEIEELRKAGLSFEEERPEAVSGGPFEGQVWCVTGSFRHFTPRSRAEELISSLGGRVVSSVSSKTTHLLVGENPGSKLEKARSLGVQLVTEDQFIEMLKGAGVDPLG